MKKHEIDTLKEQLKNEKKVINSIKAVYKDALENINQKTESFYLQMLKIQLNLDDSVDLTPEKIAEMKSQMQSKIYQAQYQEQLKAQLEEGMKIIESGSYERIHAYLNNCYEDGFIGAMYSMHNQGVPLIIPIDAGAVRKAVLLDSKISKGLYSKIVKDVNDLKRRIASEVSRGVAQAMPYSEIARNINNTSRIGLNKAFRIAKTEGHRITQASAYDAMKSAKEKGADVVKQWDATLDGKTRDSHRQLDGQIRELDEPFEVNGHEAMFPSDFGRPEEDINCRCVCLQRARWALDDDELETLKERAAFHGLQVKDSKEFGHAKAKDFADFKKKYLDATRLRQNEDVKISKKMNRNELSVNRNLVNSKKYHDKFESLPVSKKTSQAAYIESKEILDHRDGTAFEDVVVIDARTGEKILVNNTYEKEFRSAITQKEYEQVINHKGGVVLIHNHAQGTRLSHTDIFTAFKTPNVEYSMAVGHNGSVYMIYDFDRKIDVEKIYEKVYNNVMELLGNKDLARLKATDALYKSGAFKFVEK